MLAAQPEVDASGQQHLTPPAPPRIGTQALSDAPAGELWQRREKRTAGGASTPACCVVPSRLPPVRALGPVRSPWRCSAAPSCCAAGPTSWLRRVDAGVLASRRRLRAAMPPHDDAPLARMSRASSRDALNAKEGRRGCARGGPHWEIVTSDPRIGADVCQPPRDRIWRSALWLSVRASS